MAMDEFEVIRRFAVDRSPPTPGAREAARARLVAHVEGCDVASTDADTRGTLRHIAEMVESLQANWREGLDPEHAVYVSRCVLRDIATGRLDPVEHFDAMKLAAEPQLHCADGDPLLVLDAANHAMATFRVAEAAAGSSEQRLELRCGVMLLRARALHVAGKTQEALRNAYMTLLWLENIAEGPRSLAAALSDPQPNAVARQTVATVAVLAPAARRTTFAPKLRDHLVDVCRYYASAYVDSRAPVYPATAALAAQVFYLLISEARTDDADLIRMLYDLDERTRPDDTCGRITRPLRDLALATYQGNRLASEHFAREAAACLERMSLVRHQGVLAELRASWR